MRFESKKKYLQLSTKADGVVVQVDPNLKVETRTVAYLRIRYPEVHAAFIRARRDGRLSQIHAIEIDGRTWIFFPISITDSREQRLRRLRKRLPKLAYFIERRRLSTVSIPAIGCQWGVLHWMHVQGLVRSTFGDVSATTMYIHHASYFSVVEDFRQLSVVLPERAPSRLDSLVESKNYGVDSRLIRGIILREALREGTQGLVQFLPPPPGISSQWNDVTISTNIEETSLLRAEMALLDWLERHGDDQVEPTTRNTARTAILFGLDVMERRTRSRPPMVQLPIVLPLSTGSEPLWQCLKSTLIRRGWPSDDVTTVCRLVKAYYLHGSPRIEQLVAPGLQVDPRNPADAIVWSYERERAVTLQRWQVLLSPNRC